MERIHTGFSAIGCVSKPVTPNLSGRIAVNAEKDMC